LIPRDILLPDNEQKEIYHKKLIEKFSIVNYYFFFIKKGKKISINVAEEYLFKNKWDLKLADDDFENDYKLNNKK
jgi:hypothetical protein